jgi:hypothetical protein
MRKALTFLGLVTTASFMHFDHPIAIGLGLVRWLLSLCDLPVERTIYANRTECNGPIFPKGPTLPLPIPPSNNYGHGENSSCYYLG